MTNTATPAPQFRNLPTTGLTVADVAEGLDDLRARAQFRVPVPDLPCGAGAVADHR